MSDESKWLEEIEGDFAKEKVEREAAKARMEEFLRANTSKVPCSRCGAECESILPLAVLGPGVKVVCSRCAPAPSSSHARVDRF